MAVDLIKPDDDDEQETSPRVVELVPVDDVDDELVDDEGAADTSRLRAWYGRAVEEVRHVEADGPVPSAFTLPSLRPFLVDRGGLVAVKTGSVVIVRWAWTMTRRGWVLVVEAVRKGRGRAKARPVTAAADKADDGEQAEGGKAPKAPAKGQAKKKAAKGGKKKPPPPARKGVTVDTVLGGLVFAGMGAMFLVNNVLPGIGGAFLAAGDWVLEHPAALLRGVGLFLIVFVPAAWVVGGVVARQDHEAEDHDGGEAEGDEETESPEDHEDGQGSGETEADSDSGEVAEISPEQEAEQARIRVYNWVRSHMSGDRNVHLRELLIDAQKQPGGEGLTMAQLRAALDAHQIPIRPSVKAPASDHNGAARNRPGVHRHDVPQGVTPLPTPGSNLIRLLPAYQASDQQ